MSLSEDKVKELLGRSVSQDEIAMELATKVHEIIEAEKVVFDLRLERDILMHRLFKAGFPTSAIAGIAGIDRHKAAKIIQFLDMQRRINLDSPNPPEWFGK